MNEYKGRGLLSLTPHGTDIGLMMIFGGMTAIAIGGYIFRPQVFRPTIKSQINSFVKEGIEKYDRNRNVELNRKELIDFLKECYKGKNFTQAKLESIGGKVFEKYDINRNEELNRRELSDFVGDYVKPPVQGGQ